MLEDGEYYQFYGEVYCTKHPAYTSCTLFKIGDKGLAVIQQYQDTLESGEPYTVWRSIDPRLCDPIYTNENFKAYFDKYADYPTCNPYSDWHHGHYNDIYPAVTVRQIMWALKMKPLPKEPWETSFDHCPVL